MPFGIGIWEMTILLFVVLLVFGPKRLPEMGRSLGRGMRELKDGITSHTDPLREAVAGETEHVAVVDVDAVEDVDDHPVAPTRQSPSASVPERLPVL